MTIEDIQAVKAALIKEVMRLKTGAESKQCQLKGYAEERQSQETQRRIQAIDLKIQYYTWMIQDLQVMSEKKLLKEVNQHATVI